MCFVDQLSGGREPAKTTLRGVVSIQSISQARNADDKESRVGVVTQGFRNREAVYFIIDDGVRGLGASRGKSAVVFSR